MGGKDVPCMSYYSNPPFYGTYKDKRNKKGNRLLTLEERIDMEIVFYFGNNAPVIEEKFSIIYRIVFSNIERMGRHLFSTHDRKR